MLLQIVKKEIVNNVLSFRFMVTYALLFCLVLLAVFLMTNDYRERMREYSAALHQQREQLSALEKIEDPGQQFQQFQQATLYGARPPRELSILAKGLEGDLPTQVSSRSFAFFSGSSEDRLARNALFEIFQTPDFAYVINIVMSLLALLFVFDAICGEKEQGTLKLLLANSVPRDLVLAGKWIGGYLSVAAPFSAAALGGFAYIYATGALESSGETLARLGLIFALSLIYISAFFTLGLMISALTHRAATALLVSLLVWIVWILVVPNLAPIAARLAAPVPGRQVIEAEKQAIDREAQLLQESIGKRKVYGDQQESERIRQEADRRRRKLEEFYQDRMKGQVSLTQNLARLSPSASFLFAATRLAGTGPDLYALFQKAQERFQQTHQEYLQSIYVSGVEWTPNGPQVKNPDWFRPEALPRFSLFAEPLGDCFNAAFFDVLLLAVYNALFFMLAYAFFLRYDIT